MDIEKRLRDTEAADFLGLSVHTLRKDRIDPEATKLHIPFRRLGKRVLYRRGDLIDWQESHEEVIISEITK